MRRPTPRQSIIVALVASALVAGTWAVVAHQHQPSVQKQPPGVKSVVSYSTDKPSETTLTKDNYKSTAAADEPKYISLPTISTEGYLQKVGIDQNNQVAVPDNISLAGWYVNSVKPGTAGLSVVDGHVDGVTKSTGIFHALGDLKAGDKFQITLGNGNLRSFQVVDVKLVSTADADKTLFSHDPAIVSQLNLITCGGTYVRQDRSYDHRTIVISKLVPNA